MDYLYIRGEDLPYYAKQDSWNLLHACIYEHSQILINEYTGYGLQPIKILKSQCANMRFSDQSRYNIMFQKVIDKGGESDINYIKRFQNSKPLEVSAGNGYSEDQLMHTFS